MDTLIARQHPQAPDRVQWRLESPGSDARVAEGDWGAFAGLAAEARVIWLLPAEDVLLTEVDIANRRELRRAAPYALEDDLAEDIDTLHFAYGKAPASDPVPVAVVRNECIRAWASRLQESGIRPHAMVPEPLALPLEDGHLSVVLEDGRGVVRSSPARGLAADADTLAPLLEAEFVERPARPVALDVWRGPDATIDTPRPGVPVEEIRWAGNLLELVPTDWSRALPLNLLQGEFRARRPDRRHKPWWVAAGLAAALLLLAFTLDLMHHRTLVDLKADYETAMRDLYFATFPDARRAPDPRLLMEQRLTSMQQDSGDGAATAFLGLLDATAAVVSATNDARVLSLRYRDGRLDVELDAASAGALDSIKQAIESRGLKASLQSVDSQGARVNGRLYVER